MSVALNLIASLLQLIVPSYALRLVRRFGSQRVGWFIVVTFLSLALLHLMGPMRPPGSASITLNAIYAVGSVLLLIGMGHVETLCTERELTRRKEQKLKEQWELQAREEAAHLVRSNQELLQEIARREQVETQLHESVAQYRLLFTENPQQIELSSGGIDFGGDLGVGEAVRDLVGLAELAFDLDEKGGHLAASGWWQSSKISGLRQGALALQGDAD